MLFYTLLVVVIVVINVFYLGLAFLKFVIEHDVGPVKFFHDDSFINDHLAPSAITIMS